MTHFAWKNGFKIRKSNERTCLKCVYVTTCALIRNKTTELFPCAGDRQVCMSALNTHTHMQIYLHSKRLSNKASHFHIEMLLALCIQNIWGFSLLQFIGELSNVQNIFAVENNWTIHLNDSVKYYAETIKMNFILDIFNGFVWWEKDDLLDISQLSQRMFRSSGWSLVTLLSFQTDGK